MAFYHGVEVIKKAQQTVPIVEQPNGIIGIVGYSMYEPQDKPDSEIFYVRRREDAAGFGPAVFWKNGNIAATIQEIMNQGATGIMVVNAFDPATHLTVFTGNMTYVVGENTVNLVSEFGNLPYLGAQITVTNKKDGVITPVVLVDGTDYTINIEGVFNLINPLAAVAGDDIEFVYSFFDETKVVNADLTAAAAKFDYAFAAYGSKPSIWVSPNKTVSAGSWFYPMVKDVLLTLADKHRGHALIDGESGWTVNDAISARGTQGSIFSTSSTRAIGLFPEQVYQGVVIPFSAIYAGVMASVPYYISPSNREMRFVTAPKVPISYDAENALNTEANDLNAAGIVTVGSGFGTGLRTWGNRSMAYPTVTSTDNFISAQRIEDVLHSSVARASVEFLDVNNINSATIDLVKNSVNLFINQLIGIGALVDGSISYDPDKNPAVQLANGQLVFDIEFAQSLPLERLTFNSTVNINLYNILNQQ